MSDSRVVLRTARSPVAPNKRALGRVAKRLGLTIIGERCNDDLQVIGKLLEEHGAVAAGRGMYLLAADHLVRVLNAVAELERKMEIAAPGVASEEKLAWAKLRADLISKAAELGQNMIKSETILRDLPKPVQSNASFAPGSIVGPVQIVMHKEPGQSEAVEVNGE